MSDFVKKDSEIVYSQAVKAGKRMYYLDVKKSRNEDLYLAITESKKRGNFEDGQVSFEKHKIFLYKEDFQDFTDSLNNVIEFIKAELGEPIVTRAEYAKRYEESQGEVAEEVEVAGEEVKKSFFDKFRL